MWNTNFVNHPYINEKYMKLGRTTISSYLLNFFDIFLSFPFAQEIIWQCSRLICYKYKKKYKKICM